MHAGAEATEPVSGIRALQRASNREGSAEARNLMHGPKANGHGLSCPGRASG
jgi:hypothetical protein